MHFSDSHLEQKDWVEMANPYILWRGFSTSIPLVETPSDRSLRMAFNQSKRIFRNASKNLYARAVLFLPLAAQCTDFSSVRVVNIHARPRAARASRKREGRVDTNCICVLFSISSSSFHPILNKTNTTMSDFALAGKHVNVAMMTSGGLAPCLSSSVSQLAHYWVEAKRAGQISGLTLRMYRDGYKGVLIGDSFTVPEDEWDGMAVLNFLGGSPIGNSRVKVRKQQ
jgi:hypothetical protein